MSEDFTTSFTVDQSPAEAFAAITNPRGWWSEAIEGGTEKLGDEFFYANGDTHYCTMRLTEVVPDERVVWHVVDNHFEFTNDEREWIGNDITFDIRAVDGRTQVQFTQHGLVPDYECFGVCSNAWTGYVNASLKSLIAMGKGAPNPRYSGRSRVSLGA
jgi:hypothetical protein